MELTAVTAQNNLWLQLVRRLRLKAPQNKKKVKHRTKIITLDKELSSII